MEESKVNTAERILIEHAFYSYKDDDNELYFKITLDDGAKAMEEYAQSYITKVEAEVDSLRISNALGKGINDDLEAKNLGFIEDMYELEMKNKELKELLSECDDLFCRLEDYTHGKDGVDITMIRGRISEKALNNK